MMLIISRTIGGNERQAIDYSSLSHITDICKFLNISMDDSLRFILDNEKILWPIDSVDSDSRVQIDENSLSLGELLSRSHGLKPREWLSLAMSLASSILQLHSTPWLPENWCNRSIY